MFNFIEKTVFFCSYDCKYKHYSSDIAEIKCNNCNKIFKRKEHRINKTGNNFCSKNCSDIYHSGKNHYEWKELNHDKKFKNKLSKWSRTVKKRDNYTCQICGNTDKRLLQSHHIKEKTNYPELIFDLDNGITLCLKCHAEEHKDNPKIQRLILNYSSKYFDLINESKRNKTILNK